jgi:hypothetical protein
VLQPCGLSTFVKDSAQHTNKRVVQLKIYHVTEPITMQR